MSKSSLVCAVHVVEDSHIAWARLGPHSQPRTQREPAPTCGLGLATGSRLLARARRMSLRGFIRSLTESEWRLTYVLTAVGDPIRLWEEANWKRKARRQREADGLVKALWSYVQSAPPGGTEELVALEERIKRYRDGNRRKP